MNTHRRAALTLASVAAALLLIAPDARAQLAPQNDDVNVQQLGHFMVRVRALGVIPENASSAISAIGGSVGVTATPAPEVDLSFFFNDHLAVEAIAASTRHEIAAQHSALGHVDVGSVYVLPPTLTLQYHFSPHSRFSPYVGAGLTAAFFYDSRPAGPTVTKAGLSNAVGAAIQFGFDYHIAGPWFANFDVKQVFLDTEARLNGGTIIAKTALDPTIIGAGIGYRF